MKSILVLCFVYINWLASGTHSANTGILHPIGTEIPLSSHFEHVEQHMEYAPPRYLADNIIHKKAIPTNCWWGNLIAHDKHNSMNPVWANPYVIRPEIASRPYGFQITYPYTHRKLGGSSGNSGASAYYIHASVRDIVLSAKEFHSAPHYEVYDWDDFSVSHRIARAKFAAEKMESTLVSGMAFVTSKYNDLTPVISTNHAILQINGQRPDKGSYTGKKFTVQFNNGQTWAIFSKETITFQRHNNQLIATKKITGHIRVARAVDGDNLAKKYEKYAGCVVEGAVLSVFNSKSYDFNWKTTGECNKGLLHYALLHHKESMDTSTARHLPGMTQQSSTRGPMEAFVTRTRDLKWHLSEAREEKIRFTPPRTPSSHDVHKYRIKKHLEDDINRKWNMNKGGSHYFNGKAAQKYANLCLMANEVAITGSSRNQLLAKCLSKLETIMEYFISNTWTYPLVYDKIYGGIVSKEGLVKNDLNADFGNTMYNDHHFHYGYWITTAAIIRHLHPSWSKMGKLSWVIHDLLRDVVNPSDKDKYFAKFRNFDWFNGHSYSHGVTPFGDGKDQESSSEDINFHYGIMLWGKATGNKNLEDLGELMVKINTHAIQTYFLMTNANKVHPRQFIKNKVTGIFFDNKAHYATWFSAEKYCIHGIQMIPISPITESVRTRTFVKEEWDEILSKLPIIAGNKNDNPWASLLIANYATVNKVYAMERLQHVALDDGLTRSWALYMAATRK